MKIAYTETGKCPKCGAGAFVSTKMQDAPDNPDERILTTLIWCKNNHAFGYGVRIDKEFKTSPVCLGEGDAIPLFNRDNIKEE